MGLGYGVVEAVVEAIVGTTLVGTSAGAAVHDLVNCIGVVGAGVGIELRRALCTNRSRPLE